MEHITGSDGQVNDLGFQVEPQGDSPILLVGTEKSKSTAMGFMNMGN